MHSIPYGVREEKELQLGIMRKLLPLLALSLLGSLGAVAPVSVALGPVQVSIEEGSLSELALEALRGEYTEEWLWEYTESPMLFAAAYSPLLHSLLPMDGVLIGEEKDGALKVLDQATGAVLSLSFCGGKLSAVTPLSLPEGLFEEEEEEESLPVETGEDVEEELPETEDAGPSDPGVPYLYSIRFPSAT